jgi:hypothetical protein
MSSPAQTSDKVAIPFTERQMNIIHSALLCERDNLRLLMEQSKSESVTNYLRDELAELSQTTLDFRAYWRNALTADELGGE